MRNNYYDFDRYTYGEEIDALCYDDGSNSLSRRKELNRRKYSGLDTFYGDSDEYLGNW